MLSLIRRLFIVLLFLPATVFATTTPHSDIRVASPWPAQNTIIAMLGYSQNIVGTSAIAQRIPLFRQIYPGIDQVPVISVTSGHEVNPEQVIALKAQLLIIPSNMHLTQPEVLAQAGVKTLELKANSMAALRERVTLTAQALGPDAQAKDNLYQHYFDRNVALIQQRLKGLPASELVKIYHSMGTPLTTSGRPSLNQDWMDLAGAHNVAESWFGPKRNANGEVPLEKVVAANPDVIVAMNRRDAEEILHSSAWQGVSAVRLHRVYVNPQGMFWWCRETSEEAIQILWLAKTLYPARFSDIDMVKETHDFYQQFFGISLTSQQIDGILNPGA
jgi:iron complex transport system substrate-binding protein